MVPFGHTYDMFIFMGGKGYENILLSIGKTYGKHFLGPFFFRKMEPENHLFEKEAYLPNLHFSCSMLVFKLQVIRYQYQSLCQAFWES